MKVMGMIVLLVIGVTFVAAGLAHDHDWATGLGGGMLALYAAEAAKR